jgi:hypothetical protein
VFGAASRHQFRQPESDTSVGGDRGRTLKAAGDPLRERAGTDESTFPGVVRGPADRVGAHTSRESRCRMGE